MTRSLALRSCLLIALLASLALPSDGKAFTENHYLHRGYALGPFCVSGTCFWLDHTWAESNGDSSCTDDMVQSKAGPGDTSTYCYTHNSGNWACPKRVAYISYLYYNNPTSSCGAVWGLYGNCYANANNGAYLWNGVCHQATNRAFARTWVPWIKDLGWYIAGAALSYGFYGNYGALSPGSIFMWDQGC